MSHEGVPDGVGGRGVKGSSLEEVIPKAFITEEQG